MEKVGATYWADYGTLLGAVRNPMTTSADYPWLALPAAPAESLVSGIIPHDKDADFGALFSEWEKLQRVARLLEKSGYVVRERRDGDGFKVRLSRINHTHLDIFTWRERRVDEWYRSAYDWAIDNCKGRDIPQGMLFPLSTVEWEGLHLPAPNDPRRFCEFRFGPKWRTPLASNNDGVRR